MIALTHIGNIETLAFRAVVAFKLLISHKSFVYKQKKMTIETVKK